MSEGVLILQHQAALPGRREGASLVRSQRERDGSRPHQELTRRRAGPNGGEWRAMSRLSAEDIEAAFSALAAELARREVRAEVFVVGGAVMCVALKARTATKDVDAWFAPAPEVREAVRAVAASLDLPEDWLNGAAKAFLPERARFERWREWPSLEVSVADERTLLAMKCAAARTAEDAGDIRILADRLGLKSSAEVLEVVLAFFPPERLPVRAQLLLEEMFDDRG